MTLHPDLGGARRRRAVGTFPNRRAAEQALHELRDSGFPMDRISIIARDVDRNDEIAGTEVRHRDRAANKADEGATVGALSGGALGGITGLLVGLGALAIPGIGPIILAGAEATVLATALAGGAIGAVTGGLIGALVGLGIPEERARVYNDRVARGEYLVLVEGTNAELARAEAILRQRGIEEYGVYDIPERSSTATTTTTTTTATPAMAAAISNRTGVDYGGSRHAVGFFSNRRDAEAAIAELRNAGFPMSQVSLIAQRFDRREPFTGIDLHNRFDAMRLGIPADRARHFDNRLNRGDYMVTVSGSDEDIRRATPILSNYGIEEWRVYDPTTNSPATGSTGVAPVATPHTTPGAMNQTVSSRKRAIGAFPNRRDAEMALTELRDSGFPMDRVSVIGKDADRNTHIAGANVNPHAGNKADEGAKAGAATGSAIGGLGGLLIGLGALAIPGIGPVLAGGAAATALATAVTGGVIGAAAGGITGALVGWGIPEDQAKVYNDRLNRGDYIVIVDGTEDELRRAQSILNRRGIQEWGVYDASNVHMSNDRPDRVDRYNRASTNEQIISRDPDVIIIDRRNETRHNIRNERR